jgi:glycosyltransferase involved in cell wall biosynthesis
MNKKRILFVEQNNDGTIGGSHYCLLYLIQRLDRKLYEPVTIFYENISLLDRFEREGDTFVMKKAKSLSLKIDVLRKLLNMLLTVSFIVKCFFCLKSKRIDLVHLNNTVAVGYDTWLIAAMIAGIPCITHDRTFLRFEKLNLNFFKLLSKKYTKVLTVSNVIRDNLIDQGFNPSIVETVYDGIDADEYCKRVNKNKEEILAEFNIDSKTYIIGLIGNIREWKGQELLIDSLNILQWQIPKFHCLLVGDVAKNSDADLKFKEKLIKKISKYGLSDKVIFTGYRSDVPDIINALDVQINASIEPDPFPHVILEGMSLGKVVVATNLGGARESIDDGKTGYLVSSKDPLEMAEKIKHVLLDKKLKEAMSNNARERVKKLLSIERNVMQTQDIYQSIMP